MPILTPEAFFSVEEVVPLTTIINGPSAGSPAERFYLSWEWTQAPTAANGFVAISRVQICTGGGTQDWGFACTLGGTIIKQNSLNSAEFTISPYPGPVDPGYGTALGLNGLYIQNTCLYDGQFNDICNLGVIGSPTLFTFALGDTTDFSGGRYYRNPELVFQLKWEWYTPAASPPELNLRYTDLALPAVTLTAPTIAIGNANGCVAEGDNPKLYISSSTQYLRSIEIRRVLSGTPEASSFTFFPGVGTGFPTALNPWTDSLSPTNLALLAAGNLGYQAKAIYDSINGNISEWSETIIPPICEGGGGGTNGCACDDWVRDATCTGDSGSRTARRTVSTGTRREC